MTAITVSSEPQVGDLIEVNGTTLYYELRGSGPPVILISGATGDAGHYEKVVRLLVDQFSVLTYDRRANSRSPRPANWERTSADEQADDAASLLNALGLAPAAVFGSSSGAIIGLNLAIRHPAVVRGAILHEPPLMQALAEPNQVMHHVRSIVEQGMTVGGPRGAVEAFLRFAAGDPNFDALHTEVKERVLDNGETLFGVEFGAFEDYRPDDATLASIKPPVQVMAGAESPPFFRHAAQWLADRLGIPLMVMPGAHTPYHDRPQELVDAVGPFLERITRAVGVETCFGRPR